MRVFMIVCVYVWTIFQFESACEETLVSLNAKFKQGLNDELISPLVQQNRNTARPQVWKPNATCLVSHDKTACNSGAGLRAPRYFCEVSIQLFLSRWSWMYTSRLHNGNKWCFMCSPNSCIRIFKTMKRKNCKKTHAMLESYYILVS